MKTSPRRRPFPARLPVGLRLAVVAVLAVLLGGCFGLRPTPVPVNTLSLTESSSADCLLVLMPGRGDRPQRYAENGFADVVRDSGVEADVLGVDMHLGYFRDKTVADRLHQDVVAPALERGQKVWLGGISLGGLGSLLYMARQPGNVEGAILLSPYLGEGKVLDEIEAAGSLAAWEPPELDPAPSEPPEGQEVWQRLWIFLQQSLENPDSPPLYLAYGNGDRLSRAHHLLARELPDDQVVVVDGGHDWEAWVPLWEELMAETVPLCQ